MMVGELAIMAAVLIGFSIDPWSGPGASQASGYNTSTQRAVPVTPSMPMSSHGGAEMSPDMTFSS